MTWCGVPRSRAGTIRLSDQGMRDLRRGLDAIVAFARTVGVVLASALSRTLRSDADADAYAAREEMALSMRAVGIPLATIEAASRQGIEAMQRLHSAWIRGDQADA